jgi:4-hydroxy-tetrahydrodipicolinate reductase
MGFKIADSCLGRQVTALDRHRVVVIGACGKMGLEVVRAVSSQDDMTIVGAVDLADTSEDIGVLAGVGELGVTVISDLRKCLEASAPTHAVDFTHPGSVYRNVTETLNSGVRPVVGTSGLGTTEVEELQEQARRFRLGGVIAPNFAIGAVLMMKFAVEASKYFPSVEIVELHHDRKADAPSGTAIKTAEMIVASGSKRAERKVREIESLAGARGGVIEGIRIHSVRLPGLIAHQEVMMGDEGQTLTIRHDSMSRISFMPGVLMAIRRVAELDHLVHGLENLLGL